MGAARLAYICKYILLPTYRAATFLLLLLLLLLANLVPHNQVLASSAVSNMVIPAHTLHGINL